MGTRIETLRAGMGHNHTIVHDRIAQFFEPNARFLASNIRTVCVSRGRVSGKTEAATGKRGNVVDYPGSPRDVLTRIAASRDRLPRCFSETTRLPVASYVPGLLIPK